MGPFCLPSVRFTLLPLTAALHRPILIRHASTDSPQLPVRLVAGLWSQSYTLSSPIIAFLPSSPQHFPALIPSAPSCPLSLLSDAPVRIAGHLLSSCQRHGAGFGKLGHTGRAPRCPATAWREELPVPTNPLLIPPSKTVPS